MNSYKPQGTLLIVDDEADIRDILKDVLGELAEKVITANNGKEALDLVRSGAIDAVVSDIQMPVMTGLQFLAETRHLGLQIPFVIVTSYGDQANLLEAIRLNATDFVSKPFNDKELSSVIQCALELGVAQRELDKELDEALSKANLPADEAIRIREHRKIILGMKSAKVRLKRSMAA